MTERFEKYKHAFDELNVLVTTSYASAEGTNDQKSVTIIDDFLSFMINAYRLGTLDADEMLEVQKSEDERDEDFIEDMFLAIYADIEDKTFADRIEEHVAKGDLEALKKLAESEYHRVYNAGLSDEASRVEVEEDIEITKTWKTMLDDRVRETHDYLEGKKVMLHDEFVTFDGDSALYPGGFSKPENNIRCRCVLELNRS